VVELEKSPLAGKRIVITRAALQSDAISKQLSALGAIPIVFPLVAFTDPDVFARLDAALAQMDAFDWVIFTSGQAVRAVVTRSEALKVSLKPVGSRPLFAAVGPVSAKAVRQAGLAVEYVANTHNGVALADELGERLRGRSVLVPRSDQANRDLPAALKRQGAQVTEVTAYRTLQPTDVDKRKLDRIAAGEADAILFFSPSAVRNFGVLAGVEQLRHLQDKLAITAVGPVTAGALREAGAERIVVAGDTTTMAVVQVLEEHFAKTIRQSAAGVKR
jgi:uroporphyrinogen III methyltransferase/synthase